MRIRNKFRLLALCLSLLFPLMSQAATLASPEEDRKAKQALPAQGKALLYLYRTDSGARVSPTVRLNNRELGALAPRTYYMLQIAPGRVDLRAGDEAPFSVRAQDGRIYFIHLDVGRDGEGKLEQVSYGRGRREVHAARLAREGQPETVQRDKLREEAGTARAGFNILAKGGLFTLASGSQTVLATALDIDTASTALGLEGEWITATGWAFGAEYLGHSHGYTSAGGSGDLSATVIMLNVKKYFRYGSTVQPYLGVGIGSAAAKMSGAINGSAGGSAFQAMGGVAFRGKHVGGYTELKYQGAKAEDANGEAVDVGGVGLFAGISAQF